MSSRPGSDDPGYITDAGLMQFQHDIRTGFDGQAPWRRDCTCDHRKGEHVQGIDHCSRCRCQRYVAGQHESLDIELHHQAAKWLPEGVYVQGMGNPDRAGFVKFRLRRDYDSAAIKVVRSGVRQTTLRPEGATE